MGTAREGRFDGHERLSTYNFGCDNWLSMDLFHWVGTQALVCNGWFQEPLLSPPQNRPTQLFYKMADSKPNVLVLGGCGFIGRNLIVHLVTNDLCASITTADKSLPMTSWLTPGQKEAFEKVKFQQVNLSKDSFLAKVFTEPGQYDYVFNCAAETKASQSAEDYEQRVLELSRKSAEAAAKNKVKRFIEVSDAAVYKAADGKKCKENAKIEPWTVVAKYKAQVEEALPKIEGFDFFFSSISLFCLLFFLFFCGVGLIYFS